MSVVPAQDWADQLSLPPVTWEGAGIGLVALAAAVVVGLVVERGVRGYLRWRGRGPSAVGVFGRLARWAVLLLGIGIALTVTFPSVRPINVLGGLGVISIAAGIAFQTVLGNMFAGIMILSGDRYVVGDQIAVRDLRGEITEMTLNTTAVRTFDGRKVLVPNQVMHSEPVTVQTGYEQVRSSVTVQVDAAADPARTQRVAVEAMRAVPEVAEHPAPEALLTVLDKGALTVELRFWSGARQLETREAQHAVIAAVVAGFSRHGVRLADEVQTIEAGPDLLGVLRGGSVAG